ncbi:MAG: exodeoxyribonuclease VII small subunit [Prevotellaceae bacterium]|jgi:exodeoxyribonuclease VII small subunit|nr:exodeoxyribonuclease VII small subunit [Prevotellaceae bacterium]
MTKEIETYSQAEERLEQIVSKMESNEYEIDELTDRVKEALALISFCKNTLTQTDKALEKLLPETVDMDSICDE